MEIFKKIHKNYQVSNTGIISSKARQGSKGGILRPFNAHGYYMISLSQENKKSVYLIHRLVAEAFIPNPLNKPCINHKNGIKTDNRVKNLEWCTYSENIQHAYKNGLWKPAKGEKVYSSKLKNKQVEEIRQKYSTGNCTQRELAKEYNISTGTISMIIDNKRWKDKLYIKFEKRQKLNKPEIREKFAIGNYTLKQLAKEYNSSISEIWRIIRNINRRKNV